jgi:uncharacterized cofD-like protein
MKILNLVLFCGGSGSASLVRELAKRANTISTTLVINPFDDGKSTGMISENIEGLPGISDFRKNIVNASPLATAKFLNTRVNDVALGNGLIASLYLSSGCFQTAVDKAAELFNVPLKLCSVTNSPAKLSASLEDGGFLLDESSIVNYSGPSVIKDLSISGIASINPDCLEAIYNADVIIYGAGTQHSSLFPSYLAISSFSDLDIASVKAKKFLVANIDYEGDTNGWSLDDLIKSLHRYWKAPLGSALDDIIVDCSSVFYQNNYSCDNYRSTYYTDKHDGEVLLNEILLKHKRDKRTS